MSMIESDHKYSFSQLQSFDECPYSYYLERIEQVDVVENAFAQQGTLIHNLLDEWAKGNIKKEDLVSEYKNRYASCVVCSWPHILASKGYAEKTYQQGVDYFTNFNAFEGYTIISAEEAFDTNIDGRHFRGVIDMILQKDNEFIVLDHKSKSLSSFKSSQKKMYKQQYMYAKYVKEKYGKYPTTLAFNLFKENGLIMSKPFDEQEYNETIQWAIDTMEKIESYDLIDWYDAKDKSDFFCQNICSVRTHCPNGKYN